MAAKKTEEKNEKLSVEEAFSKIEEKIHIRSSLKVA